MHFADVHVNSPPVEVQRADALHDFSNADKCRQGFSGSTLTGEFWEGGLDGISGTLGFPLERRVSLMLTQRFLEGWAFALAYRREASACLDVSHMH